MPRSTWSPSAEFAPEYLVGLASYYETELGVRMGITPALPLGREIVNPGRKQLIAQSMIALIQRAQDGQNPDAVYIGLTHYDMYIEGKSWRYAYSYRTVERHAVVSSARTYRGPARRYSERTEVDPACARWSPRPSASCTTASR